MTDPKPTIGDVARLAGVSRATVSRVINDAPGVSGPVRSRVRQAVAQLGDRPNETARKLASGWQRTGYPPGLSLNARPYYSRVLAGRMFSCKSTWRGGREQPSASTRWLDPRNSDEGGR